MAFNGTGAFTRVYSWVADKAAGIKISADRNDREDTEVADGLSNVLCKDGQQTATTPISFAAGVKISDGTVGAPHASFINDTDTGFYRIGTNNLGIAAGGVKVVDVSTAAATGVVFSGVLALGTPLKVAAGGTGVAQADTARVYSNNTTTVGEGTVIIDFEAEDHDTNGIHSNTNNKSRLTVQTAGTYLIVGNVLFSGTSADTISPRHARIKKNGTTYLASESKPTLKNSNLPLNPVAIAQLVATDYVELEVQAESVADSNVIATAGVSPIFSLIRLSA